LEWYSVYTVGDQTGCKEAINNNCMMGGREKLIFAPAISTTTMIQVIW
jgi:hypothetical protein